MSRIGTTIQARLDDGKKVLIPYIVAGDPDLELSLQLMHGLVAAGADIIELGVPFSDPSSDGETIQKGVERSLAGGTSLLDVLKLVGTFREQNKDTPVVLMGYLNPIEAMGYEQFVDSARQVGVDGVLLVDMPPSESSRLSALLTEAGLDLIFLVAPTTRDERARQIASKCTGYLYYVSLKGVTGAALSDTDSVASNVNRLREFCDLPVVIGFGIKDAASAARMAALADGVVMGSALVEKIAGLQPGQALDQDGITETVSLIAAARDRLDRAD